MATVIKSEFIIISSRVFKEIDLIIKGISHERGILIFQARGAIKSKKRFGGGSLESFCYSELCYELPKKEGSWNQLKESKLIEGFEGIRSNYQKLESAFRVLGYLDKLDFLEDSNHSSPLFYLLGHTLRAYNSQSDWIRIETQFIAKFLYEQGVLDLSNNNNDMLKLVQMRFNQSTLDLKNPIDELLLELKDNIQDYLSSHFKIKD